MDHGYDIELTAIHTLRASEAIDERHARALARAILDRQQWCSAVPIERRSGLVMDGNHRLYAARLLGLRTLPCVLLDYSDRRVSVHAWADGQAFDLAYLYGTIAAGQVLPYKTTRHRFQPALPSINLPLALLRQTEPLSLRQG
ncbi:MULTISPECIES: transcriptional regulator [Pseudomonas]|uniref:transcriptional regulator n=1 Tax=Pseudomonas TaxID=286 RepID=UPI001EFFB66D|nr:MULTISPECIES: transcriptional regulator [Pseudomonas]MCG8291802.1 transcriptional regulator [Pseudomonas entomophila]